MTFAIHYSSIQPGLGQEKQIFGLNVAVGGWLNAYFTYARTEHFTFLVGHTQEQNEIREMAACAGLDEKRLRILDSRYPEKNLANIDTLFRPEPSACNLLWQRQFTHDFSFCSLAHAISGVEAGLVLQEYCLSPSDTSDAIVCPSHAVKSAIASFWDCYADYLGQHLGATYRCPVQLPVIPLGIDVAAFEKRVTPDKRVKQRAALGLGDDDIMLLWVGRLSAAIKAHPLAMFRAAESAAQNTDKHVHLVMVGYFVPPEAEKQFTLLAKDMCTQAKVTFIAADDARFPDGLWAAGDIFVSLIDNAQESFGLTPIEAMAAGLPRVISDWDGYRDSVEDGEDGFLVRTMQPPAGNGLALTFGVACQRDLYGSFLAKTALTTAVDAQQAAEYIVRLIRNPELRTSMAAKARKRAKAVYDWRCIIPVYEELWRDLAARRGAASPKKWSSALPVLPDPYTMYRAYPTATLAESDNIRLILGVEQIRALLQHEINILPSDIGLDADGVVTLLKWMAHHPTVEIPISAVFAQFPLLDRAILWRTLAWLQKLGILENKAGGAFLKP